MPSSAELAAWGKIGGHSKWAATVDRAAATAAARAAFERRFEQYPDPESARKAYFARLALKSAIARQRKKAA